MTSRSNTRCHSCQVHATILRTSELLSTTFLRRPTQQVPGCVSVVGRPTRRRASQVRPYGSPTVKGQGHHHRIALTRMRRLTVWAKLNLAWHQSDPIVHASHDAQLDSLVDVRGAPAAMSQVARNASK